MFIAIKAGVVLSNDPTCNFCDLLLGFFRKFSGLKARTIRFVYTSLKVGNYPLDAKVNHIAFDPSVVIVPASALSFRSHLERQPLFLFGAVLD